jgi:arginase
MPIEYEEIKVTSPLCNKEHADKTHEEGHVLAKNIQNVIKSSEQLRNQTFKALQDGYYPVVLGGDHSQAIGSIAGMKKMYPNGKLIWIDAHIDANTPTSSPSRNAHGMPLSYLAGIVPLYQNWACVDLKKDLCYFGIRSYEELEE